MKTALRRVRSRARDRFSRRGHEDNPFFRIEGSKTIFECVGDVRVKVPSRAVFDARGLSLAAVADVASDHPLAQLPLASLREASRNDQGPPGAGDRPAFQTFEAYECLAASNPNLVRSPYTPYDERVLDYMDAYRKRLAASVATVEESDLLTVVIPTHNRASSLPRAIQAVVDQTYQNWELIVVDDGSTDGTAAIVEAIDDPRVRYVSHERNRGHAAARNTGIRESRGQYVAYLDSDDTWDPEFLRVMWAAARRGGHRFVYSAQLVWRPPGTLDAKGDRQRVLRYAPYNRSLLENNNYISMIAVLHERELAFEAGLLDEDFRRYADWEFFLRLTEAEPPLAVPAILSHYFQSASAAVSRDESRDEFLARLLDKLGRDRQLSPVQEVARGIRTDDEAIRHVAGAQCFGAVPADASAPAEPPRRPTTIVIPSYESVEFLELCVRSIRAFTHPSVRVVIVDNASGPACEAYLDSLAGDASIEVIRNDTNEGFTVAVNQGIEAADPDSDVVLMNNDAMVTPGWLDALHEVCSVGADVGLVAPRQVLLPWTDTIRRHVPGADESRETDTNLSAHHDNVIGVNAAGRPGWFELDYAPFFCVLITREALDRCGMLDHENAPHYKSDRIYCDVIRHWAGLRLLYTPSSKVYHFHQRATTVLREQDGDRFEQMRSGTLAGGLSSVPPAVR